jgi:hypothetical protein
VVHQEGLWGPNQRQFKRFRIPVSVRFVLISGEDRRHSSRFFHTRLWDIGLRGVSFIAPSLTLEGINFFYDTIPTVRNKILMQIQLPEKHGTITALGEAVHSRAVQIIEREAYLVGIHFLQISESHGAKLRAFLNGVGEDASSREVDA